MLDPGLAVSVVAAGLLGIHSNDARVAGKRKEADAVNVANKTKWGSPWLRAVVDGKTNHALEVGEAWVTRVETHAQPMRTKAIRHVEAAATMSEELQLKRSHTYLFFLDSSRCNLSFA
eukprot:Em0004g1611a